MNTEKDKLPTEETDGGYPIEIYTDERIEEFLAENTLTAEEKKRIEEKLRKLKVQNQ
jgi:hypothetical protein